MKTSRYRGWAVLATGFLAGSMLAAPQTSETPGEPSQSPAEQRTFEPGPRVVGDARSQEEWDAWQLIEQAPTVEEKASLARRFLENYPDSGLTPHAHRIIGAHLYQQGEFDEFIPHAEAVIEEIPDAVDTLSELAFLYAERKQPARAVDLAQRALNELETVQKPLQAPTRPWVSEMYRVRAESHYALGRARLSQYSEAPEAEREKLLGEAIAQLESALTYRPDHDFASFRLGFAERNQGDVRGTLMAYGRAAAIGGVAAEPSRAAIKEVLGIIERANPTSDWASKTVQDVITMASQTLERDQSRVASQISQIVQQIEAQQRSMQPPTENTGPATWESVEPGFER